MEPSRKGAKQRNNVQWKTKVRTCCQLKVPLSTSAALLTGSSHALQLREDCRKLAERRRSDVLARHRSSCSPEQLKVRPPPRVSPGF
jgi:hypothetical protein